MVERRKATLSEEDREAIAQKVFDKFQDQFFRNVGLGVWRAVWKGIIIGLLAVASYGAGSSNFFKIGN